MTESIFSIGSLEAGSDFLVVISDQLALQYIAFSLHLCYQRPD